MTLAQMTARQSMRTEAVILVLIESVRLEAGLQQAPLG